MKPLPALLALAVIVAAEPWSTPGFSLIYMYHVKASGLLSLRGKEIDGTITYTYLNTTDNTIYVNMTINANITLLNGKTKKLTTSSIVKFRKDMSLVFLTNETLEKLKERLRCDGSSCTLNMSVERTLKTGAKVFLNATSKFDLKYMVLTQSRSSLEMTTLSGRVLGRMSNEVMLIKIIPRSTGTSR